eukprot:1751929-Rhodomonas_salina.1
MEELAGGGVPPETCALHSSVPVYSCWPTTPIPMRCCAGGGVPVTEAVTSAHSPETGSYTCRSLKLFPARAPPDREHSSQTPQRHASRSSTPTPPQTHARARAVSLSALAIKRCALHTYLQAPVPETDKAGPRRPPGPPPTWAR